MFVSCVHPVAAHNAAFCMTCSLLMLVEDTRGDHMEEAYSTAGLITFSKLNSADLRTLCGTCGTTNSKRYPGAKSCNALYIYSSRAIPP